MAAETPVGQRGVSDPQNTDRSPEYPHGKSPVRGYQGTETHSASLAVLDNAYLQEPSNACHLAQGRQQ